MLEEDNEVERAVKLTKLNHIKLNIRVPIYKAEFKKIIINMMLKCRIYYIMVQVSKGWFSEMVMEN